MKRVAALFLSSLFVASAPLTALAAPVDFARDVYPILQKSCFECHGEQKQKGKLRLDTRDLATKGGSHGISITAGKPDESELLRRVTLPKDAEDVMPARGDLLTKEQVAVLREWISQGAIWPDKVEPLKHWSYVKPVRPELPNVKDSGWARNPIDPFVLARLEKEGLHPSPEADPATLIRRASLDVTGLPPTPSEVEAFLKDNSPNAFEKVVDRLLASPQFGERWARPWLDAAHYADSHGFQRDDLRDLWAYRDWVIKSLNADMPFDRFTIEQIAGDLLPNATADQKIATGFGRCAPTNVEAGSDPEETRVNQVLDRVNTAGAVWLGTTMECCQCHDHKYDPFTQKDYYQLFAYFNNTALEADRSKADVPGSIQFIGPSMSLPVNPTTVPSDVVEGKSKALRKIDRSLRERREALAAGQEKWETTLLASVGKTAESHLLEVADFESTAGAGHRILEDHSILLVDDPPDKDTYVVTVQTKLTGITGFKLETLTDPSLPGEGPGRGDDDRTNFVLNTFAVTAMPANAKGKPKAVKLAKAKADFSQTRFGPEGAIDDNPKSAWAINPQFHKPHWATFDTTEPIGTSEGTTLTFTLVQEFGGGKTIGRLRLSALTGDRNTEPVPSDVLQIVRIPKAKRTAAQTKQIVAYREEHDTAYTKLKTTREELVDGNAGKKAAKVASTLVMQELDKPRPSAIFMRGSFRDHGAAVQPGTPAILNQTPEGPPTRATLARWLVDRDNPLTARVTVNRWWAEMFGRGIVSTVEDFGIKGEPPTHPELLDWMAVQFMDDGWSMKKTLRRIVLSATYRQSSRMSSEMLERDDQNRLLARGPRFRMDAEMIRDNALASSGLISLKQYGPPIHPYQPDGLWTKVGGGKVEYLVSPGEERYRRGVYVVWKRAAPYPSFVNFDATARMACTLKRSRSNTPLQALTLLNDPVYVEAAMALGKRIVTERPRGNVQERIAYAMGLCVAREPESRELEALERLYEAQRDAARDNPKLAKDLFSAFPVPANVSPEEFAGWYAVSTALLNLDETITKG